MKSIPSAPEGLLPPSLCPPSPLLSFHLSFLCLRSIPSSFFLLLWSWNHPLMSSLCLSPEREKLEPRESHELNTTLLHFLLPLPIPPAFLPSIFFCLSCLSSDRLVEHVSSNQIHTAVLLMFSNTTAVANVCYTMDLTCKTRLNKAYRVHEFISTIGEEKEKNLVQINTGN